MTSSHTPILPYFAFCRLVPSRGTYDLASLYNSYSKFYEMNTANSKDNLSNLDLLKDCKQVGLEFPEFPEGGEFYNKVEDKIDYMEKSLRSSKSGRSFFYGMIKQNRKIATDAIAEALDSATDLIMLAEETLGSGKYDEVSKELMGNYQAHIDRFKEAEMTGYFDYRMGGFDKLSKFKEVFNNDTTNTETYETKYKVMLKVFKEFKKELRT